MSLHNPAFWGTVCVGSVDLHALDFTLWALIGFSLATTWEVQNNWPTIMYPAYDQGQGTSPLLKVIDRDLLRRQLEIRNGELHLDPATVSIDRSFAYCYACYAMAPEALLQSFPDAYGYLKDRIFIGREYRGQRFALGGSQVMMRA